ncbi:MAG: L,D-transpeptidase [Beijerinckiaceae bacterium]|nr:L,D-transpeptidase [Beijerinckiaceae bacterium]
MFHRVTSLWPTAIAVMITLGAAPASATVDIRIDLSTQTMKVTSARGGTEVWPVSTGRSGYVTPRGSYRPIRLARMHYSRKYDNAPMPYSIFFKGGYAIHGTGAVRQLGRPASHGCVRLAPRNAARLFSMVQAEGARITLTGSPPAERARVRAASAR